MGLLGDRDLNKEFGFGSGEREKFSVSDKSYNYERELHGRDGRVGMGNAGERRVDYLGIGEHLNYTAMKDSYSGLWSSGVGDDGKRYDGLPIGAGCGPASLDSIVPDRWGNGDLTFVCGGHDDCYESGQDRLTCDQELRRELYSTCWEAQKSFEFCEFVSLTYFSFVRVFGRKYYGGSGNPD